MKDDFNGARVTPHDAVRVERLISRVQKLRVAALELYQYLNAATEGSLPQLRLYAERAAEAEAVSEGSQKAKIRRQIATLRFQLKRELWNEELATIKRELDQLVQHFAEFDSESELSALLEVCADA